MVKVRCQDCGKVFKVKKDDVEDTACDCGGDLEIFGSEENTYEETKGSICNKEVNGDDSLYTCDECGTEYTCDECIHEFENAGVYICEDCLADLVIVQEKVEYKEKIVEKPVKVYVNQEGFPIDNTFNPNSKCKFD